MSISIGIVSPSVRMHLPVHASSSESALRESIKRHMEQGALTGIMLDSRRGLAGGGDRHHHGLSVEQQGRDEDHEHVVEEHHAQEESADLERR